MIFSKNNLTTLINYPDRYLIEFHDILTYYLGQILPMPLEPGNETIDFIILDDEDSLSENIISSLKVASKTEVHHQPSLSKKEYSKYFNQLLLTSLDNLGKQSDANSKQAFSILESFDSKWFLPNNIIIIKKYPLLKCWGLESRYFMNSQTKSKVDKKSKSKLNMLKSKITNILFPQYIQSLCTI